MPRTTSPTLLRPGKFTRPRREARKTDIVHRAQNLLSDTSTSYLANIASWADTYRTTAAGKFSAPYHFIDAQDSPPTTCNVNYARDCTSSGCSISAIANYTQRVADSTQSAAHKTEALKCESARDTKWVFRLSSWSEICRISYQLKSKHLFVSHSLDAEPFR